MDRQHGSSAASTTSTYVLRELIKDVPLSEDENGQNGHITCVDAWNGNLYIGTSSGEVLHYVSIPPDPEDDAGQPTYIFATKLEPAYNTRQSGVDEGVKQILLLPDATQDGNGGKACVLCNGTLTFYTLPELSPAFEGQIKQSGCTWVGGLDEDAPGALQESTRGGGVVIVICLKQRLRLIRIGKDARKIRDIELGGVEALSRRRDLACVADGNRYSLLDVVNQRAIELFPISSLPPPVPEEEPLPEAPSAQGHRSSRSVSSASPARQDRSHERNVSTGGLPRDKSRLKPENSSPWPARGSSRQTLSPNQPSSREQSPTKSDEPSPRGSAESERKPEEKAPVPPPKLPPNVAAPTPKEFFLTTGTRLEDPGVGITVDHDSEPTRGALEFSSYPESLVLEGTGISGFAPAEEETEGYVLALVRRQTTQGVQRAIEVQRWDIDPGETQQDKEWLFLGSWREDEQGKRCAGLRKATSGVELSVPEIGINLRQRRLRIENTSRDPEEAEIKRNHDEDKFTGRFSQLQASVLFHGRDTVSWVTKNPLVTQLERQLGLAVQQGSNQKVNVDVAGVKRVINSIRGQEPKDELEFLTLEYIRRKASLLLFGHLVLQTANGVVCYERDKRDAEEALISGDLDPRIVVVLVPPLAVEVQEGKNGMWLAQGLIDAFAMLRSSYDERSIAQDTKGAYGDNLLGIIKRYLLAWRKKKGFGSVADEEHVFRTVDAALLHVLLLLDQSSPRGPATPGSVRAELNDVVDKGVDCFERAIELFEEFDRLFMLSRLYQSKKMSTQVLATWKRILSGETDAGGEMVEGEHDLRRYLTKIRDKALVEEYGAWLANRNPKLGVQVFADETSRVHFEPAEAVEVLKQHAPGAVKDYLEHLVFGKNHVQYANDLITFYLDTVLHELETSLEAKDTLTSSYETYRALTSPKPRYTDFLTDNAPAEKAEWWHNRLRLLQLIGGSHGAASQYDVHALGERLTPYADELVPEMIILSGREGKHEEALRLLVHGLGDHDTAIRYCLLGGSSIFHSASYYTTHPPTQSVTLPTHDEQAQLFHHLLHNFLHLPNLSERLERSSELLARFSGFYEIETVLDLIPEEWSVELVGGFLVHAWRRLVQEKRESVVVKALCGAQNLRRVVEWGDRIEKVDPVVVRQDDEEDAEVTEN